MQCFKFLGRYTLLGFTILLLSISSSNAALLTFTDRASWQAAAGGGVGDQFENFNSFTDDVGYGPFYAQPTVTAGFLTFEVVNGGSDGSWRIDAPTHNIFTSVNGTSSATALGIGEPSLGFGDTLMSFGAVRALGFDYAGTVYSKTDGILTTNRGDSITIPKLADGAVAFIGLLYNAGENFTSLEWGAVATLTTADFEDFGMALDDVEAFSTLNPVPVPAAIWLFGTALIGLVRFGKRKASVSV